MDFHAPALPLRPVEYIGRTCPGFIRGACLFFGSSGEAGAPLISPGAIYNRMATQEEGARPSRHAGQLRAALGAVVASRARSCI